MPEQHATHDLEALVAFVDGELTGPEAERFQAQLETCAPCASLALDLRSLAAATRANPTPSRARDFRLTPADAARLLPLAVIAGQHDTHDPERVTAYLDGALATTDRPIVAGWLAACDPCARLRDDLVAIADAHRAMPTPPRPSDYRLTGAEAARLGRAGWRGWLDRIGSARDLVTRPLATGLTAIGIAGLLISANPLGTLGGASPILSTVGAALPAPQAANGSGAGKSGPNRMDSDPGSVEGYSQASSAPSMLTVQPSQSGASAGPAAAASGDMGVTAAPLTSQPEPSGSPAAADAGAAPSSAVDSTLAAGGPSPAESASTPPVPLLPILSIAALLLGLAMFGLRRIARQGQPA